ncbi:hypothetical protein ACFCT7_14480 [Fulvivirgaceae bacterium LMO-SS25]
MLVKSLRLFLFLVIVSLPISKIFGQSGFREGYVITISNDSLPGFLDYGAGLNLHESVKFKSQKNLPAQEFSPNDLKRFRFSNDKLYKSLKVGENSDLIFVEVLVEGRLTLSKYKKLFFLEKINDDTIYEISEKVKENSGTGSLEQNRTTRHLGILKVLLNDSERPLNIEGFSISEKKFTELIVEYNSMFGEPLAYKDQKPWARLQLGATFGLSNSNLIIEKFSMGANFSNFSEFEYDLSPTIGFNFLLTRPRLSELTGFYGEVLFTQSEYSAVNSTTIPYVGKQYINISVRSIKIPIAFRYMISKQEFGPYLNVGLVYYYHFSSKSSRIDEIRTAEGFETVEREGLKLKNSELGGWVGLGLNKALTKKFSGLAEFRYELSNGIVSDFKTGSGMLQYDYGSQKRHHFSFVLGIQFR